MCHYFTECVKASIVFFEMYLKKKQKKHEFKRKKDIFKIYGTQSHFMYGYRWASEMKNTILKIFRTKTFESKFLYPSEPLNGSVRSQ